MQSREAGRGNKPFTTLLAAGRRVRFMSWQQPLQGWDCVALTKEAGNAHAVWDPGLAGRS